MGDCLDLLGFVHFKDSDEHMDPVDALPPGVSEEDVDLFKLAQEKAQDLMNKVIICLFCSKHTLP